MLIDDVRVIFTNINEGFLYPLWESKGYRLGPKERFFKIEGDNEFRLTSHLIRRPRQSFGETSFCAGVAFIRLWKFVRPFRAFERTDLYSAAGCGGLIDRVIPSRLRRVKWSLIEPGTDSEAVGNELVHQFETRVFPFLEHYRKLEHAVEYWEGYKHINGMSRAAAILLLGDRDRAFADLAQQITDAEQDLRERGRPGEQMIVDQLREFWKYLESADTAKFSYAAK
jgi:hypothetical protein